MKYYAIKQEYNNIYSLYQCKMLRSSKTNYTFEHSVNYIYAIYFPIIGTGRSRFDASDFPIKKLT